MSRGRDREIGSGRSGPPALHIAALAVAAGLAIWVTGPLAFAPRPTRDGVGAFDRALAPLRQRLSPSARVALFLPTDDLAPWFIAQYTLAPATVVRVLPKDCAIGSAAPCAADATHVLVFTNRPEDAAALGARLGFVPDTALGGLVLLARRSR